MDETDKNNVYNFVVSLTVDKRGVSRVLVGRPERKRILGRSAVDGSVISNLIFKKWDGTWTGLIWLRIGTGVGLL